MKDERSKTLFILHPASFILLAQVALLGVLPLLNVGCHHREVAALRVGNGAEPQDLDPHVVTGIPEHRIISTLFEGLVDCDPGDLHVIPAVAESWSVSEDGRQYVFHLRGDAAWSNGDPVTADDFVYGWRRILTPALGAQYAQMLYCLKNARPYHEGKLKDFGEVGARALDARTLEVTL
ncbi:MAG: ABC transporter substrate-binding protein, partial [Candidatus Hydrogenedentes bacterium]|nr:ABC transporter substrate-binding protein [Candidatus Hydrogenedentota bacterium]